MANDLTAAMGNRSIRTIKTELEFLTDANLITPQAMTSILAQLPNHNFVTISHAAETETDPAASMARMNLRNNDEKKGNFYATPNTPTAQQQQQPQPPAYAQAPAPPTTLTYATALYAYAPTDAGDLALSPQDRVAVTEYMNAEWWKGRSERTGQEGIFPRSYVRTEDIPTGPASNGTSYGNMPMDVSQGGPMMQQQQQQVPGKGAEMGKKFGKKLGNAAIFGAGATLGSDLVNSIF